MSTSSGAICLYLVSRERGLQKLHSFVAPAMLFCGWQCAQNREHVPRLGSEGGTTQGWNLCSPKSVIESQKWADAWERTWRSDDGNGLSKYRKWSDWLQERRGNQSVDSHRTSERSSRRAPAAVCPIQTSETLLFLRMHRTSTSWHTSSAKSSSIEMGSNRKARHHRRTTSERYRVNSSIDARGRRASTSNGKRD